MKPNTNNIVAATAAAAALAGGEAQANHTPTTPLTPATQEAVQLLADQASQTPLTPDSIITLPAPAAPEFIPEKKGGAEQIVPGGPGDSSDVLGTGPVDQDVNGAGFTKSELANQPAGEDGFKPGEVPSTSKDSDVALINGGLAEHIPYPAAQESSGTIVAALQEMEEIARGVGEAATQDIIVKNIAKIPADDDQPKKLQRPENPEAITNYVPGEPNKYDYAEQLLLDVAQPKNPDNPNSGRPASDENPLPTDGPVSTELADTVVTMGQELSAQIEPSVPKETAPAINPGD